MEKTENDRLAFASTFPLLGAKSNTTNIFHKNKRGRYSRKIAYIQIIKYLDKDTKQLEKKVITHYNPNFYER